MTSINRPARPINASNCPRIWDARPGVGREPVGNRTTSLAVFSTK
jgi:hypothetical protein